jgi:hypothetical protein
MEARGLGEGWSDTLAKYVMLQDAIFTLMMSCFGVSWAWQTTTPIEDFVMGYVKYLCAKSFDSRRLWQRICDRYAWRYSTPPLLGLPVRTVIRFVSSLGLIRALHAV